VLQARTILFSLFLFTGLVSCNYSNTESVNQRSARSESVEATEASADVKAKEQTCPAWIDADESSCALLLQQASSANLAELKNVLLTKDQTGKKKFWKGFALLAKEAQKTGSIEWAKVVALLEQHTKPGIISSIAKPNYQPLQIDVLRRDCYLPNGGDTACDGRDGDQSNISVEIRASGSKSFVRKVLPFEASSTTVEHICPDNDTARIELQFVTENPTGVYTLNKDIIGGPIGFRRDEQTLWIGFEKENVGGSATYSDNDDVVIQIRCPNARRIEIANLCIDPNIPASPHAGGPRRRITGPQYSGPGSDIITDELMNASNDYPRRCTGL
jgi:hypothetical protein